MILGKIFNHSEPLFPHLKTGENNIYFNFQFSNFILVAQGPHCGAQALLTADMNSRGRGLR